MPGAVSVRARVTRERLRAYQERLSLPSASASPAWPTAAVDDVVILATLHGAPVVRQLGAAQLAGDTVHVDKGATTRRCLANGVTQRLAQAVVLDGVETTATSRCASDDRLFHRPVLGDVDGLRFDVVTGVGDVLAEQTAMFAALVVNNADLIVAETVYMVFVEVEEGIVDEEAFYLILPIGKHQAAGPAAVGEIEAVVLVAPGLAVEEIQPLIGKTAAGMVIHHIQDHSDAVQMTEIHQQS